MKSELTVRERVLKHVSKKTIGSSFTSVQLSKETKIPRTSFSNVLKDLVEDGVLERSKPAGKLYGRSSLLTVKSPLDSIVHVGLVPNIASEMGVSTVDILFSLVSELKDAIQRVEDLKKAINTVSID